MKKQEQMRAGLIGAGEKVLEQSTQVAGRLTEREREVAEFVMGLIENKKIGLGWQFGLRRFNRLFIDWSDGKATAKASDVPSVKEISNAMRSLYGRCEPFGFMPVVRANEDGAVIIDCVRWQAEFYAERKARKAGGRDPRPVVLDYDDLIAGFGALDTCDLVEMRREIDRLLSERAVPVKKTA